MQLKKQYKAVFIDLDDTLWDFHTNARLTLKTIFVNHSLQRYFENFDRFFDVYAARNIQLWEAYSKSEITKDFLMTERFRYPLATAGIYNVPLAEQMGIEFLDLLPDQTTLMPHALELLPYLSSKYPLTIISNGFIEVQYRKMKSSRIEPYVTHIVLSEAVGVLKPEKAIFDYALTLNNLDAHDVVMIGDSYAADIVGARNAGIDQIYYPLNYPTDRDAIQSTHTIRSLQDVFDIL